MFKLFESIVAGAIFTYKSIDGQISRFGTDGGKIGGFRIVIMKSINGIEFPMAMATLNLELKPQILVTESLWELKDSKIKDAIISHELGHLTNDLDLLRDIANTANPKYVDDIKLEFSADKFAVNQGYDMINALRFLMKEVPWWTFYSKRLLRKRIKHLEEEI